MAGEKLMLGGTTAPWQSIPNALQMIALELRLGLR